jgi:hypothetical protein
VYRPVWVDTELRTNEAGTAVESQLITWVVVLPIAIPVSPPTPLRVVTDVFVLGSLIIHPLGAGEVGTVIVLAPA